MKTNASGSRRDFLGKLAVLSAVASGANLSAKASVQEERAIPEIPNFKKD